MSEYHKIQSVFKRDPATKNKRFLMWEWTLPEFAYLANIAWVGTEKVDGTSVRLYKNGFIGGRTDNAQLHQGLFAHLLTVSKKLQETLLPEDTILYGEGYGAKIQSGGQYIPGGQSFVLFDVNISGNWQPRSSIEDVAAMLDIPVVPILQQQSLHWWIEAIQGKTFYESLLHPGAKNEGVVLRPAVELRTRTGKRIITKLKFKDFGL